MSCNFSIGDAISRINVAQSKYLNNVKLNNTRTNLRILYLLHKNGLIRGFNIRQHKLIVLLKYKNRKPVIKNIKTISRPGKRVYWKIKFLNLHYNPSSFSGLYIISSPKGFITSSDSLLGLGLTGEIILKITI